MTPDAEKTRLEFDVKVSRVQTSRDGSSSVTLTLVKPDVNVFGWLAAAQLGKVTLRCMVEQVELKHGTIRL